MAIEDCMLPQKALESWQPAAVAKALQDLPFEDMIHRVSSKCTSLWVITPTKAISFELFVIPSQAKLAYKFSDSGSSVGVTQYFTISLLQNTVTPTFVATVISAVITISNVTA
ncbi:hypothetical protein PAXRUDRAFT_492588 [Paxillus rubicundulus Ve08.2h10]|uniref:Uncharacterized protein n=1 Tax=Paxillus rubicundulus Ve08.2h10 TaxID=930991 RepID=A0A0D0D9P8_9AGAM|nr:hypothetical protein PAXRUDRAFT_492588 [Paxillus rubicundulus Ve08.2h10]